MKDEKDEKTIDLVDYIDNHKSQVVGYVRISSGNQKTDRQLDGCKLDKVFTDVASGGTLDRPQLNAMMDYIREGDTILVHSLDRLGRDLSDLTDIINMITKKGATVRFITEHFEFSPDKNNPVVKLMFQLLASFAEFERQRIRERQRQGIDKILSNPVKRKKKYKGRAKKLDENQVARLKELAKLKNQNIEEWKKTSWGKIASELGVTKQTVYNYLKDLKDE